MESAEFVWTYGASLLTSWFGLVAVVLTVNDVSGYAFGRSWEWPRKHRMPILLSLLFFAQYESYRTIAQRAHRDEQAAAVLISKLEGQIASHQETISDKDRQLQSKAEQIEELRSAAIRAPVPVDVRVQNVPPAGLLPSYSLSDDSPSTFWGSLEGGEWLNPRGAYKDVLVNWDDVPADVDALAELGIAIIAPGHGWVEVRLLDLTSGSVAAETGRLEVATSEGNDRIKRTLPIKAQKGRRSYKLQVRGSKDTSINVRGELVFVRKARWG